MADKDEDMVDETAQPMENGNGDSENRAEEVDSVEEMSEEEFQCLNDQLDQLNQVLDTLESKNDNIRAQLVELLKSSREARDQFQASNDEQIKKEEPQP